MEAVSKAAKSLNGWPAPSHDAVSEYLEVRNRRICRVCLKKGHNARTCPIKSRPVRYIDEVKKHHTAQNDADAAKAVLALTRSLLMLSDLTLPVPRGTLELAETEAQAAAADIPAIDPTPVMSQDLLASSNGSQSFVSPLDTRIGQVLARHGRGWCLGHRDGDGASQLVPVSRRADQPLSERLADADNCCTGQPRGRRDAFCCLHLEPCPGGVFVINRFYIYLYSEPEVATVKDGTATMRTGIE